MHEKISGISAILGFIYLALRQKMNLSQVKRLVEKELESPPKLISFTRMASKRIWVGVSIALLWCGHHLFFVDFDQFIRIVVMIFAVILLLFLVLVIIGYFFRGGIGFSKEYFLWHTVRSDIIIPWHLFSGYELGEFNRNPVLRLYLHENAVETINFPTAKSRDFFHRIVKMNSASHGCHLLFMLSNFEDRPVDIAHSFQTYFPTTATL